MSKIDFSDFILRCKNINIDGTSLPNDWFKANQSKPKVTVYLSKESTLENCRKWAMAFFYGDEIGSEVLVEYLYHLASNVEEELKETWSSYGQIIMAGKITPLSLLNVQEKFKDQVVKVTVDKFVTEKDDKYLLIMIAGMIRYTICKDEKQKSKLSEKIKSIVSTYRTDTRHPIEMKLILNNTLEILLSAYDMFFHKFPGNKFSDARVGTSVLRYNGLTGLTDMLHLAKLLGKEKISETLPFIYEMFLERQFCKILKETDGELEVSHSYLPYVRSMWVIAKSPYSVTQNKSIHFFVHCCGSLFGDPRSINSKMSQADSIAKVAENACLVFLSSKHEKKLSDFTFTRSRLFLSNEDKKTIELAVNAIKQPHDGTIGAWVKTNLMSMIN